MPDVLGMRARNGKSYGAVAALATALVIAAACATPKPAAERHQPVLCDHGKCPYAHSCRYRDVDGKQVGECRLEVGRCYSDWDCAPSAQRCQRFNADPGTCVMSGL